MQPDISILAAMIADKARAKMLIALMSGKAHTATELALEAEITTQTASSHLAKLLQHNLLQVRKQGRHKYFQLYSQQVAALLEQMLNLGSQLLPDIHTGPKDPMLRQARVCYDHLAGQFATRLFDELLTKGLLDESPEQLTLTPAGETFFQQLGADLSQLKKQRLLCKSCLDWSERRSHLAGALGKWLLEFMLERNWFERVPDSRSLIPTAKGKKQLQAHFFS